LRLDLAEAIQRKCSLGTQEVLALHAMEYPHRRISKNPGNALG
jgi:hypothetical protein